MASLRTILGLKRPKPPEPAKAPRQGYIVTARNCPVPLLVTIAVRK
jgi:hypothetical protein